MKSPTSPRIRCWPEASSDDVNVTQKESPVSFSSEEIEKHNLLFEEAGRLIAGEILLDGRPLPAPGWFARRRLKRAKALFEATIAINPAGWNAMFMIGKIEQREERRQEALDWMLKAREFAPENTSLAKEASAMASQLGMHDMSARIADEAIVLKPDDAALVVNSGLAHILSGHFEIALGRFRDAVRIEPHQETNRRLEDYAAKVLAGSLPAPKVEADIIRGTKIA